MIVILLLLIPLLLLFSDFFLRLVRGSSYSSSSTSTMSSTSSTSSSTSSLSPGYCDPVTIKRIALRAGNQIPAIGLGVYQSAPGEETYDAVLNALRIGYRHIDTAQLYQNEADVGKAVADSGIPRTEIFITTKIDVFRNFGYEKTVKSVRKSLKDLRSEYIDLVLLHAPGDPHLRDGSYKALEEAHKSGLIKSIGVSNFGIAHLEKLKTTAEVQPSVNQIEIHPWLQRKEIVQYCQEHNIVVQAYSPLAKATKLKDPVLVEIASRLSMTPAQVLIAWGLKKNLVTLPKSVNPERQASNLASLGYLETIDEGDMAKLDALDSYYTTGWDPIRQHKV